MGQEHDFVAKLFIDHSCYHLASRGIVKDFPLISPKFAAPVVTRSFISKLLTCVLRPG